MVCSHTTIVIIIIIIMTKYQIDPHDPLWDGVKELADQRLDNFVEELLAEEVLANSEASCLSEDHIEAAKDVLQRPTAEGEP
jgi:hypothetical protein